MTVLFLQEMCAVEIPAIKNRSAIDTYYKNEKLKGLPAAKPKSAAFAGKLLPGRFIDPLKANKAGLFVEFHFVQEGSSIAALCYVCQMIQ